MAVKPVEIHPAALGELKSAVSWYVQRSEPAALNFNSQVDEALALIVEAPRRWLSGDHGTRKFVLRHFPYAIFYRELTIQMVAVAHGRREPGYWKDRR
jgi:toxin ParE1/3/4